MNEFGNKTKLVYAGWPDAIGFTIARSSRSTVASKATCALGGIRTPEQQTITRLATCAV